MAFYQVLVEGSNLRIPGASSGEELAGFFTNRVVYATTPLSAGNKALEMIRQEWQAPEYSSKRGAQDLVLTVSEVGSATLLGWARAPNRGFTFFAETSPREA